jgi:hypothetical protein
LAAIKPVLQISTNIKGDRRTKSVVFAMPNFLLREVKTY